MTKVATLLGPQVTELYEQTMDKLEALRSERVRINEEIKDLVVEERELRKYVRLFDPDKIRNHKIDDDGDGDEQ